MKKGFQFRFCAPDSLTHLLLCMVLGCLLLQVRSLISKSVGRPVVHLWKMGARQSASSPLQSFTGENQASSQPLGAHVAVIGAGGAGLAAGRFLREAGLQVKILEKSNDIGGLWKYQDGGAVYNSLVTNLPKEIMQFIDFPYKSSLPSFVTHGDMYTYLQEYAKAFDLYSLVETNAPVHSVRQSHQKSSNIFDKLPAWEVEWERNGKSCVETFDAVVICNGHYEKASLPQIPNLQAYKGRIMHSIEYDDPEEFEGLKVLCIGARASGTDIAREVSMVASEVHVCDKDCNQMETGGALKNIFRQPELLSFTQDGKAQFSNGQAAEVDVVVFCTGYDYHFPFLGDGLVDSNNRRVHPLYEHLFHCELPNLSFVGIPHRVNENPEAKFKSECDFLGCRCVVPFPLFDLQSRWVASVYSKKVQLPDSQGMFAWLENHYQSLDESGKRMRDAHHMSSKQWAYCRNVALLSQSIDMKNLGDILAVNEQIYNDVANHRPTFPGGSDTYRKMNYHVNRDTCSWIVSHDSN